MGVPKRLLWVLVALLGALAMGVIAVARGEPINAVWLVTAAGCIYALGYRFYVAYRIVGLNDRRAAEPTVDSDLESSVAAKWMVQSL